MVSRDTPHIAATRIMISAVWLCLGGLAQALALAWPWGGQSLPALQIIGMATLASHLIRCRNPKTAFLQSWWFATVWLVGTFWWLFISLHTYGGMHELLAAMAVVLLAAALALYYAVAGWATVKVMGPEKRSMALSIVVFASAWTLAEVARAVLFTGFPWGAVGYAHVDGVISSFAPWVGVYGMGWLAAATAIAIAHFLSRDHLSTHTQRKPARLVWGSMALASLLVVQLPGYKYAFSSASTSGDLQVHLMQGNIAQSEKFQPSTGIAQALRWYQQALLYVHSGLAIAPETALPLLPIHLPAGYWDQLRQHFATGSAAALIGVPWKAINAAGEPMYSNAAIGWKPDQTQDYRYEKNHLVPFGEFVPPMFRWFTQLMNMPLGDFKAGGEYPDTFVMDKWFFQRYEPEWTNDSVELVPMHDEAFPKLGKPAPLTSYQKDGKFISFYGDNHPVYAGNVVKAMASAKNGYPYVVKLFEKQLASLTSAQQSERDADLKSLFARLDEAFNATIVAINRLTPTIIEVVVKAPLAAEKFYPGQFYRVQNYEAFAPTVEGTVLAAEGLALTGAEVDKEKGTISLIALEMGSSSRLCATWKVGDPLVIMGVTGTPTDIPSNQTVLLIGGGLGNAVLFSIGKALRAAGNRVVYFAGYKFAQDRFKVEDVEAAADLIIWAVDKGEGVQAIVPTRPQDKSFVGNILECMVAYAKGELGEQPISLAEVDHLVVIGSDRMMAAVKSARFDVLKPYLNKAHHAIGSINSPMQCMMKGICAQCLCKHVDADTGKEYFVYSCYNQDQDLDKVDFPHLNARLRQNTVQEKLSNLWLDYLLEKQ